MLRNGSPIPIITTLVIGRLVLSPLCNPISVATRQTWPMISDTFKLRLKPCCAVEQNVHSRAHPTCEDTHSVARSFSGIQTVSTSWPPSRIIAYLMVPSLATCLTEISGALISHCACNFARNFLLMLLISSKLSMPK